MRDLVGIDTEAERIYQRAGLDLSVGAAPARIIRSILGAAAVHFVPPTALRNGGALARVGADWRIYLSSGLPPREVGFVALHELAHFVLGESGTEDECNALAAALLAPAPAFRRLAEDGRAGVFSRLAKWFNCSESLAALRMGELGTPTALVTPDSVRTRGDGFSWPAAPDLRKLAAKKTMPGIRKARLRDDPRRIVLRAV